MKIKNQPNYFLPLSILLGLMSITSHAYAFNYIEQLQQEAAKRELHREPYWLALGHYTEVGKFSEKYESYTDDHNFFISDDEFDSRWFQMSYQTGHC